MAIEISKDVQKIIKTYSIIYTIIFVFGIPILALIVSLVIFFNLKSQTWGEVNSISEINKIDKIVENKIAEFREFNQKSYNVLQWSWYKDLQIKVYNWPFEIKNWYLKSINNVLSYKNIILPNYVSHKLPLPIQAKSYFLKVWYDITQLSNFINTIVLTQISLNNFPKYKRPDLLTIPNKNIIDYFFLSCLTKNTLISTVCNEYTKHFIKVMPYYDLELDKNWIETVGAKLVANPEFKSGFCNSVLLYLKNSNKADISFANIAKSCGEKVENYYDTIKDLNKIKDDLKEVSSAYVSDDREINAYKLLSLQQIIYNEVLKKRLNSPRIAVYLQFLKWLLKNDKYIEHFYLDEAFLFNNDYLAKVLKSPIFNLSNWQKEENKILLQKIREVNLWSELEWYKWLYKKIYNKSLADIVQQDTLQWEEEKWQEITLRDRFLAKFKFPDLDIKDLKQKWDKILAKWYIKIRLSKDDKKKKFPINLIFSDYRWSFVVDWIKIKWEDQLNQILNTIVSKNKLTMAELYESIKQNVELFSQKQQQPTLCDLISWSVEWVQACTNNQVSIKVKSGSQSFIYTILHKNWVYQNILATDKTLQAQLQQHFSWYQTNELNFVDFIKEVVKFKPEVQKVEVENDITQAERTIIDDDFKTYLDSDVDAIVKKDWEILVSFKMWDLELIALYDLDKHMIKSVMFKKLWIKSLIRWINLKLNEDNTDQIEYFVEDTLNFLKKYNPKIVEDYLKN